MTMPTMPKEGKKARELEYGRAVGSLIIQVDSEIERIISLLEFMRNYLITQAQKVVLDEIERTKAELDKQKAEQEIESGFREGLQAPPSTNLRYSREQEIKSGSRQNSFYQQIVEEAKEKYKEEKAKKDAERLKADKENLVKFANELLENWLNLVK